MLGAACTAREGDYQLKCESRAGDGEWKKATTRKSDWVRGDYFVRATMRPVKGPVPAIHFWAAERLVSVTLNGAPLVQPLGSDSYFLLPPDHEGQLVEAHYYSRS